MCVVIDTCCLPDVFDGTSSKHPKFSPVLAWINGNGKMIYGGTKYNRELVQIKKFLPIIVELQRKQRVKKIPDADVDQIANELKLAFPEREFDDEHIVALVIVARCAVVCTHDKTAMQYLRNKNLFSRFAGVARPAIFSGHKSNSNLCSPKNIVGACIE